MSHVASVRGETLRLSCHMHIVYTQHASVLIETRRIPASSSRLRASLRYCQRVTGFLHLIGISVPLRTFVMLAIGCRIPAICMLACHSQLDAMHTPKMRSALVDIFDIRHRSNDPM